MKAKKVPVTRRGVIAGASALGAWGALAEGADKRADAWDKETDVIVIGGATGLAAAIVAAQANLRVVVLEKAAYPGGNMLVSGGIIWIPDNPVMKREGIEDDREQALEYLRHLAQGQSDESMLAAFLDGGARMLEFFEQHTRIRWRVSKAMGPVHDYHPNWRGAVTRGRSVEIVQEEVARSGGLLVTTLFGEAQERGVELLTSTPARRLVSRETPEGREVLGVVADSGGKPLRIRATRGVVVASGGYERNWELKRHFLRSPSPYTLGAETNTGDGLRMGMELGADLRNMNSAWGIVAYKGEAEATGHVLGGISTNAQRELRNAGGMCVNRHGRRFGNEAADYASSWRTYGTWENWGEHRYANIPAYSLFDHGARERSRIAGATKGEPLPEWFHVADSLDALAERLGIDKAGLRETVAQFNAGAAAGRDPLFHRGENAWDQSGTGSSRRTLAPLEQAPFYGAEVVPADLGTCGGLRVNAQAQVIDVFERPIKRLHASGNVSGVGGPGSLYGGGGGTLGPAMAFAYLAGKSIVDSA